VLGHNHRMTSRLRTLALLLLVTAVCVTNAGCPEKGPAEKAGEKIDDAVDTTKDAAKDVAKEVKDGAKEVKKGDQ
jgi:outer membrane lipoprotein-sorting protein